MSGSTLFTATNEESAAVSVALSTAWIFPLVKNYNATNQTTTMYWVTKTSGVYKIWGQGVKDGLNFEWVQKANTEGCTGEFVVNGKEERTCLFKIKTSAKAGRSTSEVITLKARKFRSR